MYGECRKSETRPKVEWHFGQSQTSSFAIKAIATGSAIAKKRRSKVIKSKTTSHLASMLDGVEETPGNPNANAISASDAQSLPGLTLQRPTVQEAQAQAKRIREQRVFAKAETYRRASWKSSGIVKGRFHEAAAWQVSEVGKAWVGNDGALTSREESVGSGVAQGWQGNGSPLATPMPPAKVGHARRSSGEAALSLKKVLSDSMKGVRKVRRSITGSGSMSGNEQIID